MFKKYYDLIHILFNKITKQNETITFLDYLSVLKLTAFILLTVIVIGCVLYLLIWIPRKIYKATMSMGVIPYRDSMTPEEKKEWSKHVKEMSVKLQKRKILYFLGLIVFYIPFAVPTFLYIIYIIFHC